MGAGKIIGGVFLLILAIGIFGFSGWINTKTNSNIDNCNSLLGEFSQGLSSEVYQQCQATGFVNSLSKVGIFIAIIFLILGIVLIILDALGKNENKQIQMNNKSVNLSRSQKNKTENRTDNSDDRIIEKDNDDYLTRLARLDDLRKKDLITDDEYNTLRITILKKFGNLSFEPTESDSLKSNKPLSDKTEERSKDSEKKI